MAGDRSLMTCPQAGPPIARDPAITVAVTNCRTGRESDSL